MNIQFTEEEFRLLLRLVHMGEWMANSNHDELTDMEMSFIALKSKLLSHAEEAGAGSWAEYRKEDDEWEESIEFIEVIDEEGWIEDYNTIVTQEGIISTAAESELIARIGHEAFNNMDEDELEERLMSLRIEIAAEMERLSQLDAPSQDASILPFPQGN